MTYDKELHTLKTSRTLRLLNGVLNGCEFTIESSRAMVIACNSLPGESLATLNDLPADTIFLPINEHGVNFELVFDDNSEFLIRELNESSTFERSGKYNAIMEVGELQFALKKSDEEWDESILQIKSSKIIKKNSFLSPKKKHYIVVYVTVATLLMGVLTISVNVYNNESNYMRRLSQILANRELLFSDGRDHILYVIAKNHRKAIWANQVVERGDFSTARVKIISPEHEIERVNLWLADNYPDLQYFRMQLGDSLIPILLLSRQRNILTEEEKEHLRKRLMNYLPYAKYLSIIEVDDFQLVKDAEQGLSSLGVKYNINKSGNHYSYNIKGELSDTQFIKVKYFINEFYRKWGGNFIVFNVSLGTDSLKNKSFSTGDVSFIKNSSIDWDFSNQVDY